MVTISIKGASHYQQQLLTNNSNQNINKKYNIDNSNNDNNSSNNKNSNNNYQVTKNTERQKCDTIR